jgi:hypothetical protein
MCFLRADPSISELSSTEILVKVTDNRIFPVRGSGKFGIIDFKTIFHGSFGASDFIAMCSKFEVASDVTAGDLPGGRAAGEPGGQQRIASVHPLRRR